MVRGSHFLGSAGRMKAHDTICLPFVSSTPSVARTRLAAFLTVHRASDVVLDNALIVISEMIANAVSHGVPTPDGTIEISWSLNGTLLELSVYDAGVGGSLTPVEFDEDSLSGRGLSIINRVADRWWVDMSTGTRVNAELVLTPH
ncbi:ATP-binding protein [Aeromicrobium sp.]|uniref:ATP-binding protein n=1 Tax=Aeromicrobium sp. TaxID=1871063 RepID=UPI00198B96D1|nr:ATP-binding protein [Aeromicrobium sp.]MBC7632182.1 ATP-binding protein [Aeromicrobium sp.]